MKKVVPGEKLSIPAPTYNKFIDAARANERSRRTGPSDTQGKFTDTIFIRNDTEEEVPMHSVLGIGDLLFQPPDSTTPVGFSGIVPQETHKNRFVIVADPAIKPGRLGRAWIDGVHFVKVHSGSEAALVIGAEVLAGITSGLKADPKGSVQVLHRQPGEGFQWAVIRMGAPSVATALLCKIVEIDPKNQRAHVVPLTEAIDPSEKELWMDDGNFGQRFCVWTMGLTLAEVGNAAVVFASSSGSWMMEHLNLVGKDYKESCEPIGRVTPDVEHECRELVTPPVFLESFACLKSDGGCILTTLCDCAFQGGTLLVDAHGQYLAECPSEEPPDA
jgi:hypothetical protein